MERLILTWTCLLAAFFAMAAPSMEGCEAQFEAGNEAFQAGDFELAVATYEAALGTCRNFELEYNLANAHFKLGQIGPSILHYERALQLDPSDDDARNNLKLAGARVVDRIEELPTQGLRDVWERIVAKGRLRFWGGALLFLWLAGFASLSWRLFARETSMQRIATTLASVLLGLSLFVGFLYSATSHREEISHEAVIMSPTVEVRNAPQSDNSLVLFLLHEGTKGRILSRTGEWLEMELANGSVGWVTLQDVAEI